MKIAKAKVWKTQSGKLVEDGHNDAAFLVAAKGQLVPDAYVGQFDNGDDFFEDINTHRDHPVNIPATGTDDQPDSNVGVRPRGNRRKPVDPTPPEE